MNSSWFFRRVERNDKQSLRDYCTPGVLRSLLAIVLFTAALQAVPGQPGRTGAALESADADLLPCRAPVQLTTSPIDPGHIARVMSPGGQDLPSSGFTSALYFFHDTGRRIPVQAPTAGRVVQLDSMTTVVDGREQYHYAVHIAPCDGAVVRVQHVDLLTTELQLPFRGLEQSDCRSSGPSQRTMICSVRPVQALDLATGQVIGWSGEGLIGLELSFQTDTDPAAIPQDHHRLLNAFLEPVQSALRAKMAPGDQKNLTVPRTMACEGSYDCGPARGAWTGG